MDFPASAACACPCACACALLSACSCMCVCAARAQGRHHSQEARPKHGTGALMCQVMNTSGKIHMKRLSYRGIASQELIRLRHARKTTHGAWHVCVVTTVLPRNTAFACSVELAEAGAWHAGLGRMPKEKARGSAFPLALPLPREKQNAFATTQPLRTTKLVLTDSAQKIMTALRHNT
eukprot:5541227-Heterocapsa_arctica.AAC.2